MDYTDSDVLNSVIRYLEENAKTSRVEHTRGVVKTAEELAIRYGADPAKARLAAWFHDIGKDLPLDVLDGYVGKYELGDRLLGNPNLSHSKVAEIIAKRDFRIDDSDVLNAIAYHTTGREGMSLLEKIVFLADAIEPGRDHPGVEEIRDLAGIDLDRACLKVLESTIDYVKSQGLELDRDSIKARDWFMKTIEQKTVEKEYKNQ